MINTSSVPTRKALEVSLETDRARFLLRRSHTSRRPTANGIVLPGSRNPLVFLLHGITDRNRPFPPGKRKSPWWMETLGAPADNERAAELAFCSAQPSCTSHLPFRAVLFARQHSLTGLRLLAAV